jgi:molecular chaperone DnaK (HSP70)
MEDEDMHRNIKRHEFEELIMPMIDKVQVILEQALELSGKLVV